MLPANKNSMFAGIAAMGMMLLTGLLQAATGAGTSSSFALANFTGDKFQIESVVSEYAGVFVQGVSLQNEMTAWVNWQDKTPGQVFFNLNGKQKIVNTTEFWAKTIFDMGQDLNYLPGARNELSVYAVAADNTQTPVYTLNFGGTQLPDWTRHQGRIAAVIETDKETAKKVNYQGNSKYKDFSINAVADIPDLIPKIGGKWGLELDPLLFNWDLLSDFSEPGYKADFSLTGGWGGRLWGGDHGEAEIESKINGSGRCIPEFKLHDLDVYLYASRQFKTPDARLPFCPVDPCPYFNATIRTGIGGHIFLEEGTPDLVAGLKFKRGTLTFDSSIAGTVGTKLSILWDASGTIGGNPSITFQFPKAPEGDTNYCLSRYIQNIYFKIFVEARVRALLWTKKWEETFDVYTCPETSAMQLIPMQSMSTSVIELMSRDYLDAEQGYCVFPVDDPDLMRPVAIGGLPGPILNVGPSPRPSIAATNDMGVLVFVYDDASKPIGKHQEIYFARWNGNHWTTHAPITDNLKVDTHPAAAIDEAGTEIAVWMQAPEITGAEEGPEDIIGDFEVVWSKYNKATGSWQTPLALTNNQYADILPWFDRSVPGQLRVCWMSSPTNAISVWDDDSVAPLVNLMAADWNGTGFGPAYEIAENLPTALPPAVARTATHEILTWLNDHDGNAATLEDIEVVVRTRLRGGQWSEEYYLTNEAAIAKVSANVAIDRAGMPIVVWTKSQVPQMLSNGEQSTTDQVWFSAFIDGIWTEPELAFEYPGISEPTLYRNQAGKIVMYWTALSEEFVDIYYSVLDADYMLWSAAQQITFDQDVETMISVTESGGNILAAYVKERIDMSDPNLPPQIGLSDIYLLEHIPTRDLHIADVDISVSADPLVEVVNFAREWLNQDCHEPNWCNGQDFNNDGVVNFQDFSVLSGTYHAYNIRPGRTVNLTANIHLSGDYIAEDIRVDFYNGEPMGELIGSQQIPIMIPGRPIPVNLAWQIPYILDTGFVSVVIDPEGMIPDDNTENNCAYKNVLNADMKVGQPSIVAYPTVDLALVAFSVHNKGGQTLMSILCRVYMNDLEGLQIYEDTIDSLAWGTSTEIQFVWDVSDLEPGTYELFVLIDALGQNVEFDQSRHAAQATVSILPDLQIQPWSIQPAENGVEMVVRNVGPKSSQATVVKAIRDYVLIGEAQVPALNAMASATIMIPYSETVTDAVVKVIVNPDSDGTDEVSLHNNSKNVYYSVPNEAAALPQQGHIAELFSLAKSWLELPLGEQEEFVYTQQNLLSMK